jgi:hypothetical protein
LLGSLPVYDTQFKNDAAPSAALNTDVKACGPLETHFVRIDASVEKLVCGEDHASGGIEGIEGIDAYLLGAAFREQVACAVEKESVPDLVLTIAAGGFDDLYDDGLGE